MVNMNNGKKKMVTRMKEVTKVKWVMKVTEITKVKWITEVTGNIITFCLSLLPFLSMIPGTHVILVTLHYTCYLFYTCYFCYPCYFIIYATLSLVLLLLPVLLKLPLPLPLPLLLILCMLVTELAYDKHHYSVSLDNTCNVFIYHTYTLLINHLSEMCTNMDNYWTNNKLFNIIGPGNMWHNGPDIYYVIVDNKLYLPRRNYHKQ